MEGWEGRDWRWLLGQQDGVLARRQALLGGMTEGAWRHRLASGRWQSPVDGVAIAQTGPPDARQFRWAAVLAAPSGAALTGDAALVERGFRGAPARTLDVVVPPAARGRQYVLRGGPRVQVRRLLVPADALTARLGLPYVEPALAVLHAAATAPSARAAEWRLAAVVQQQLTVPPLVRARLLASPRLRRRALLLAVLDDIELGAHAGSELQFLRFCRAHGLPLPDEVQVKVRATGTYYLDARYRRQRVSVELDGAHHRETGQWEADLLRTLDLLVAQPGEQMLRLTGGLLRHDGPRVAAALRVLLL